MTAKQFNFTSGMFSSLRNRLMVLVLFALVPVIAIMVYSAEEARRADAREAKAQVLGLARRIVSRQEAVITAAAGELITIAHIPDMQSPKSSACNKFIRRLITSLRIHRTSQLYEGVLRITRYGRADCGSVDWQPGINLSERSYFKEALRTRDLVVSDYIISEIGLSPLVILAYPIVQEADAARWVLAMGIRVQWLQKFLAGQRIPPGTAVTLIDHNDLVLAQYPETAAGVGKRMSRGMLLKAISANNRGVVETTNLRGEKAHVAFMTLFPTTAKIVVERSNVDILAAANWAFMRNMGLLLGFAALAISMTWLFSHVFILRHTDRLLTVVRQLQAGNMSTRSHVSEDASELGQLARAFDDMAESLKQRTLALQESEERINAFFSHAPVGLIIWDDQLRIVMVSETMARFNKRSVADHIGKSMGEIIPNLAPRLEPIYRRILETGEPVLNKMEVRELPIAPGVNSHVLISRFPIPGPDGKPAGVGTVFSDITEHKLAEDALRKQAQIIDQLHESVISTDLEGQVMSWNKGAERLFGYAAEEALGKHISFVYPEDQHEFLQNHVIAPLKEHGEYEVEVLARHKSGEDFNAHLSLSLLRDAENSVTGMIGYTIDITARKRAETEIRERAERIRAIMDNVVDGIITIDEDSRIESVNPVVERLFGYTVGELVGRNISTLMPDPDRSAHDGYVRNYLRTGQGKLIGVGPREVRALRKDGTTFPMDLAISEMWLGDKRLFIGIVRDITVRIQVAKALRVAKDEAERANQAKSKFLAAASHDLRQPIQALGLLIASLSPRTHGEEAREIVRSMGHSVESLRALLDALLDISKLDAGVLIPDVKQFPVNATLQRIKTGFADQARDKGLDFRAVRSSAVVRSDPILLDRVLQNLVSNAIRYTKTGRVLLGCRR